jgi:flagellum-specific peptidoglycan hydrolase FlgJ
MKRLLLLPLVMTLFSACASKKLSISKINKKVENVAERKSGGNFPTFSSISYIAKFKDIAILEMNKYGVPASITLAQALLESGVGNSDLARYANNHFGIKCNSEWTGKTYYKDDDQKDDCFRVYENAEESFKDHSIFLKRKRYATLFDLPITDYKGWANGLKAAGYATNPKYPDLLINIIEKYNLQQYDDGSYVKANNLVNTEPVQPILNGNKYIVKQGDTLYNIAKRLMISVDELKELNEIKDNVIKIGQELITKK